MPLSGQREAWAVTTLLGSGVPRRLMGPVSRLPASKPVVPETETMEEMIRAVQCSRLRAALRDYQVRHSGLILPGMPLQSSPFTH